MPFPALAALAPLVMKALPAVLPNVLGALAGPLGQAAQGILGQLAQSVFSQDDKGGLFSEKVNVSVDNPLSKLNGLLGEVGKNFLSAGDSLKTIGEFLQGKPRKLENGKEIVKPHLLKPETIKILGDWSKNMASQINVNVNVNASGSAVDPATGTGGSKGSSGSRSKTLSVAGVKIDRDAFSSGLSSEQKKTLDQVKDPTAKAQMKAQMELQNMQNLMQFLSNIVRISGDISKSIIQNVRS
jgi:hypothetical protein